MTVTGVWLRDLLQFRLSTTQNDSAKSNGPHLELGNSSGILLTKADCSLTVRPGRHDMVPLQQQFSVCPIPQPRLSPGYQSSDAHPSRFLYSQPFPFSQSWRLLTLFLFSYSCMDISIVSTFGYYTKCCCEHVCTYVCLVFDSVLWGIHSGVGLLDHR